MFIRIIEFFWKNNNDLDKDSINNEDISDQIKNNIIYKDIILVKWNIVLLIWIYYLYVVYISLS